MNRSFSKSVYERGIMMEKYCRLDACYATVVGRCQKGAFLELNNGEQAFAYRFANLPIGTTVICTVLRMEREGRRKLVAVDTVCRYAGRDAA